MSVAAQQEPGLSVARRELIYLLAVIYVLAATYYEATQEVCYILFP